MAQHACSEVTLAVDTKKYGIRIHKALFRQLGSPSQIQLLVNPEAKLVAIQPVEKGTPGKQGHRIVASRMQSERSYELYSRLFVQRLRVLAPEREDGCAYRLHGSVISSKRVAVFPLETLQRVDKQEFVSL